MNIIGRVGVAVLGVVVGGAAVIGVSYQRDMTAAQARVTSGSRMIETACGRVEYGEMGDGPPVLVIHGAGGGYDQGLTLGEYLVGAGYRIIAPSRFGYANASIPADTSLAAQAEIYACLLDALNIAGPVPVVAVSMGGPSALAFAVHHAERVQSLVMAGAISFTEDLPAEAIERGNQINLAVGGSFTYWVVNRFLQPQLMELLGISREVQATLSADTRAQVERILNEMHPMAMRLPGIALDQATHLPASFASQVNVPTLVLHCEDDGLVPVYQGRHTYTAIAGDRIVTYPTGGHFFAGRFDAAQQTTRGFLLDSVRHSVVAEWR
jgi:2-hydroxy-6-oxonona-2,4-dienedioate hydrolase